MRIRSVLVASSAAVVLLAGCSGSADQSSPAESAAAPSSAASSAVPSASASSAPASSAPASPSASEDQTSGTKQVTAEKGAISFTMPCAKPRTQTFKGNANDQKRYAGGQSWLCGAGTKTSENTGVFIVELRKTPADDDAAHRELQGAAEEVLKDAKPKHGSFQGHPGVATEVTVNGRKAAMQGVSFGPYLVLFLAVPSENLSVLTDTVTIKD